MTPEGDPVTYRSLFAVKESPAPGAVRDERTDFFHLSASEQREVTRYLDYEIPLDAVPERGRVFIRRYHQEN